MISEPASAAIAYKFHEVDENAQEKNVLIFDLGGGTFDVTVLTAGAGQIDVQATSEDARLGGREIDELLVDKIVKRIENEKQVDITSDKHLLHKIRMHCEQMKKQFVNGVDVVNFKLEAQALYDQTELEEYETLVSQDDFMDVCAKVFREEEE